MKLLYTNENRFLVSNAKNLLEQANFQIVIKNEFASSGAGDLAPHDTWMELWLADDAQYEQAKTLINNSFNAISGPDWLCQRCGESNSASFEICWQCQFEKL